MYFEIITNLMIHCLLLIDLSLAILHVHDCNYYDYMLSIISYVFFLCACTCSRDARATVPK